jgi:hypothetical protein
MALVNTQSHFHSLNRNISFQFEIPEAVTDQVIRAQFYRKVKEGSGSLVMALCEPGDTKPGADKFDPGLSVRKMPLLWRLPHWVITSRDSLNDFQERDAGFVKTIDFRLKELPDKLAIYCYPQNTTSGNYVRTIFQTLPTLSRKDVAFKDITPSRDRMVALHMEKGAYQVSFTPWHQIDSARYVGIAELPGPHSDITALLIPEEWPDDQQSVNNIYTRILLQLNSVLIALADTHGDQDEIESYVEDSFSKVRALFPGRDLPTIKNLAEFLSIYIKRGCYFPYLVFEKALRSELSLMIKNQLDIARDRAADGIQYELSLLLGSRKDWSELSFKERVEIQTTWHQINRTRGAQSPEDDAEKLKLWERLIHPCNDEQKHGFDNFISSIKVQTESNANPMALIRLNGRNRPLICLSKPDSDRMPYQDCKGAILELPASANVPEKMPCFTCTICGLAGALLIAGATRLAEPILKKLRPATTETENNYGPTTEAVAKGVSPVKYQSAQLNNGDYRHSFGTILCWEDIQRVFYIFREELREPDKTMPHPCYILLASDWNWEDEGHILLSILWRGSTEEKMAGSGATSGLSQWAASQTKAGRPVAWCGFWRDDESKEWTKAFPTTPETSSCQDTFTNPSSLKLWHKAQEIITEGKYNFAYVAVFKCPAIGGHA